MRVMQFFGIQTKDVFVIRRNDGRDTGCDFYAEHGEKAGVPDAIGYSEMEHARKFRSPEAAQAFIENELPAWGRKLHHPAPIPQFMFMSTGTMSKIAGCLVRDGEIPHEFLEPTPGQLLIWRR